jgi:hypothetical protein
MSEQSPANDASNEALANNGAVEETIVSPEQAEAIVAVSDLVEAVPETTPNPPGVSGDEAPAIKLEDGTVLPQRYIKLCVPKTVPDAAVAAAWTQGQLALQNAAQGMASIIIPVVETDKDTKRQIRKMQPLAVILLDQKDAQRLIYVANTINQVNVKVLQSQDDALNLVKVNKEGAAEKDNATRNVAAEKQGLGGGIVLATSEPDAKQVSDHQKKIITG